MAKDLVKFLSLSFVLMFVMAFSSCEEDIDLDNEETSSIKVNNNGYPYVDLGLSTYWATYNIGAYYSTDQGDLYAFGETTVKSSYTNSNYIGGYYDVANIEWRGDWRLPTKSELNELLSNCSWDINTRNGVEVMTATGPNGNSIDLPYYSYIMDEGYHGWYWSSTSYSSSKAYCMHFDRNTISTGTHDKYNGFLVRAVITNPNYSSSSNGGSGETNNGGGGSTSYEKPDVGFYDFTATRTSLKVQYRIYNNDDAKVSSATIYYGTTSNPTSPKTATVNGNMITANISGLKAGTTYYVKCVAKGKGGTTTSSTTKCVTNY